MYICMGFIYIYTHTHTHTIIDTSTHNIGKYLCKWVNIIGKIVGTECN